MVKGLAFCPEMLTDLEMLSYCQHYPIALSDPSYLPPYYFDVVDTTMTGRETEYVQLYTLVGGTPQLQAEKGWHIEDTHRYMRCTVYNQQTQLNETGYTPLYEVMFDTGILIEDTSFIVAGTHNNNGLTWGHVDGYTNPRILLEHYPTRYAEILITNFRARYYNTSYWLKIDSSWYCTREEIGPMGVLLSIFPILDTLFGTPCATVSNLQAVEVDTLWATVMWSADARHHDWEVEYWPSSSPDSATVVTDSVPMVTLTGLAPGTEYSVTVRGLCDIDNYSPWSDTLLFTTPQDTTPDTLPWVIPSTLDARDMGSLDRFTRMMPNPAGEVVNVLSSYRMESIAVYNLSGRLLLEQPAEGIYATLNVSALPRGTYIVAIHTLQGVATKKLVVER